LAVGAKKGLEKSRVFVVIEGLYESRFHEARRLFE